MSDEQLILTEIHGRVGLARLNRPRALNALSLDLMRQLGDVLAAFDADPAIGSMVVTGSEKMFAAGADIKEMSDATAVAMLTTDHIGGWNRIVRMKKPLIAAGSRLARGGGRGLAMMADMVVASES